MRRIFVMALLLSFAVLALQLPGSVEVWAWSGTPEPDPSANKALVRQMIDAVFNTHDLGAIDTYFAADYVDHEPDPTQTTDLAEFRQSSAASFAAFPDIHYTIEDIAAEGDKVWTRTQICGTQTGAYGDIPPTGRHVCIEAIDIVRIAEGKFVEHWALIDELGLLRQLGALPGA